MHATWPHQSTQRRLRLSSPSTAMQSYCHYSGKGGHAVKSSMRPSPAGPSARTARSAGSHCQTLFACRRPAEFSGPGPTHLPMSRDTKDPAHSSKTRIWPSLSLATARWGPHTGQVQGIRVPPHLSKTRIWRIWVPLRSSATARHRKSPGEGSPRVIHPCLHSLHTTCAEPLLAT